MHNLSPVVFWGQEAPGSRQRLLRGEGPSLPSGCRARLVQGSYWDRHPSTRKKEASRLEMPPCLAAPLPAWPAGRGWRKCTKPSLCWPQPCEPDGHHGTDEDKRQFLCWVDYSLLETRYRFAECLPGTRHCAGCFTWLSPVIPPEGLLGGCSYLHSEV